MLLVFELCIHRCIGCFRIFTLYAKSLSLDVASRVWDVFFRDGEEFLFRTALGQFYGLLYQNVQWLVYCY